ncbi:hypothetical protein [Ensifer canadensis]
MTAAYITGTVTVTNGSTVVTGLDTAWVTTGLVAGGLFGLDSGDGNPIPIAAVDSDTKITLAKPWRGANAAGAGYWISRDTDYGRQTIRNTTALTELLLELDTRTLNAIAALASTMGANMFPYAVSTEAMAWATLQPFAREMLALGDGPSILGKIGAFSTSGGTVTGGAVFNAGVTIKGTLNAENGGIHIKGPVNTTRQLGFWTGLATPRFTLEVNTAVESGANTGADFAVNRFNDAGVWLGQPMYISRKNGTVEFPQTPQCLCYPGSGSVHVAPGNHIGLVPAGGEFAYNKAGFYAGGNPGLGGRVVHVPLTGWYRIILTATLNGSGTAILAVNAIGKLSVYSFVANWSTNTGKMLAYLSAGDYLSLSAGFASMEISMENTNVSVEWLQS